MTDDVDYRRVRGWVEYSRVGQGLVRWYFDAPIADTIDADPDPRILAFLDWVREQRATELAHDGDIPLT